MKTRKILAMLLTLAMMMGLLCTSAFATDPLTTTDEVDNLVISVDYATEGVRLYKNSSTSYTVLCDGPDNNYYPYSFSLMVNDRDYLKSPTESDPNPDVSNGGEFTWSYVQDQSGNWVEDPDSTYGLVILPSNSGSTVTVTTAQNTDITFTCATPNGGSTTTTNGVYAYLPAPGQFTNEGMATGGWGTAYTSGGALKGMKGTTVSTGVSLGFFGGYAVFDFGTVTEGTGEDAVTKGALQNDDSHPYGVDFIVYGNAFNNNSEPGCVQVSYNGQVWYDLAGSMHYDSNTKWDYKVTYVNPTPADNVNESTMGTRKNVPYYINDVVTDYGQVASNTFHNHSWFPLEANYFGADGIDYARGNTRFPFAEYLTGQSVTINGTPYSNTETLSLTGVRLGGVTSNSSASSSFGYFDCHANGNNIGTATNPYNTGNSASSGDGMDLAWAVYSSGDDAGQPVSSEILEKGFRFVRLYNGVTKDQPPFGEIGPELNGIVAVTSTSGDGTQTTDLEIYIDNQSYDEIITDNLVMTTVNVSGSGTYDIYSDEDYVFVNGQKVTCTSEDPYSFTVTLAQSESAYYQIITQNGSESPYITLLKFVGV